MAAQIFKMIRTLSFAAVISIIATSELFSRTEIKIVFTAEPPSIDGFVSDVIWESAPGISDLVQREPRTGERDIRDFQFPVYRPV